MLDDFELDYSKKTLLDSKRELVHALIRAGDPGKISIQQHLIYMCFKQSPGAVISDVRRYLSTRFPGFSNTTLYRVYNDFCKMNII
jgi:hypothetical protein